MDEDGKEEEGMECPRAGEVGAGARASAERRARPGEGRRWTEQGGEEGEGAQDEGEAHGDEAG